MVVLSVPSTIRGSPAYLHSHPPSPSSLFLQENLVVRDLFNDAGSKWDTVRINHLFPRAVARAITSIPIGLSDQNDCIQWRFSKDGAYSVKSGYWVAKRTKDVLSSKPSSSSSNSNDFWKWPWKLNIHPKVKLFIWRCLRDILPTKTKLRARGLEIDTICPRCGMAEEDLEHALRDCSWSSFYWQACVLRLPPCNSHSRPSLRNWILDSIQGRDPDFIEAFGSLIWMLWRARNLLIFQHKHLSHQDCFNQALSSLSEYQSANMKETFAQTLSSQPACWSPPPKGQLKFNSDASLGPSGTTGLGGVFRDWRGSPTRFVSGSLYDCRNIEVAEASACLRGVLAACEEGYRKVTFELDNQALVSKLRNRVLPRIELGTIIADILHFCDGLDEATFKWISRSHNRLAHEIANLARCPGFVLNLNSSISVSLRRIMIADAVGPH